MQTFAAPEVKDMTGHLMLYPYSIAEDGAVTALGAEMIPDTKTAKVRRQLARRKCARKCRQALVACKCSG